MFSLVPIAKFHVDNLVATKHVLPAAFDLKFRLVFSGTGVAASSCASSFSL